MYIVCPKCDTKFAVSQEQIGKNGRKVRCSNCSNIWHYNFVEEPKIYSQDTRKDVVTPTRGINLPVIVPTQPHKSSVPIYVLFFAIILLILMLFPEQLAIDSKLNDDVIEVNDIELVLQPEVENVVVKYKLHNISGNIVKTPLVRVRLLDKNNKVLTSNIDDHSKVDIDPDQSVQVKTEFIQNSSKVTSVDVMIGNQLDFIFF